MITVENISKVQTQIKNYGMKIVQQVANQINIVGNRIVSQLQIDYPDLTITGQFFPKNMEYWIGISRFGVEVTWIKCPISKLFFERKRDITGRQKFVSTIPELDIDALIQKIVEELSIQINLVVGRKV